MRGNGMPNINRSLCRLLCCCKSLPKKKHPGLNGFWQAKLRYENEISPTMVNWYANHHHACDKVAPADTVKAKSSRTLSTKHRNDANEHERLQCPVEQVCG
ncbi:uncharacterized protein LOC118503115 isoform X2 [Anopheles stephensi]|uniref:uncharacterized protein LOC118503115 isoform X2 n=1 Tax=Anopheles stephensi TaxID=30069 RepID=UPI0016587DE2|nr:uncharacterized protein LOC118503115 isoform X2 [Anopheles stephensi]